MNAERIFKDHDGDHLRVIISNNTVVFSHEGENIKPQGDESPCNTTQTLFYHKEARQIAAFILDILRPEPLGADENISSVSP